jgi:hypothetical protein
VAVARVELPLDRFTWPEKRNVAGLYTRLSVASHRTEALWQKQQE